MDQSKMIMKYEASQAILWHRFYSETTFEGKLRLSHWKHMLKFSSYLYDMTEPGRRYNQFKRKVKTAQIYLYR